MFRSKSFLYNRFKHQNISVDSQTSRKKYSSIKTYSKKDLLWLILLITLLIFYLVYRLIFTNNTKLYASINLYDKRIDKIALEKSQQIFEYNELPNVIFERSNDGSFRIKSSDCPRQVCVNTGFISKKDEMIVCLPKGIIVRIIDNNSSTDTLLPSEE